jgi:cytoskeletal protein CcmA (bactofilin family)
VWGQDKREVKNTVEGEAEPAEGTESPVPPPTEGPGDVIAFVGKGVEFKGVISYSGTVRIDGYLDGEIHTDGILLIGDEAIIQAKVTAGTIVCKGKITGDIIAKDRVKLRAPAVFNGSMKTPMLSMEDGVLFNGGLEMSHGVRELPQGTTLHSVGSMTPPGIKRING